MCLSNLFVDHWKLSLVWVTQYFISFSLGKTHLYLLSMFQSFRLIDVIFGWSLVTLFSGLHFQSLFPQIKFLPDKRKETLSLFSFFFLFYWKMSIVVLGNLFFSEGLLVLKIKFVIMSPSSVGKTVKRRFILVYSSNFFGCIQSLKQILYFLIHPPSHHLL